MLVGEERGMRRATQIFLRLWLLPAMLVGAAGCLGGPAPRDHVYRLQVEPPRSARSAPACPGTLEVGRIWGNALTRGRPILRSDSERAVEVTPYDYQLWVDSPTLLFQRALTEYLQQVNLAQRVVSSDANVGADWVVTGFIERLDDVTGGGAPRVLVALELSLAEADRGQLLLRKTYRVEQPTDGAGVPAAVRAFGTAAGSIFESFATDAAASR
jgi:ABC-type uncharacterized transport system auxiliary subunit